MLNLLKPDRKIIAPGDPDWDAPPPRPGRGRSGRWERLLSGRAKTTRLASGCCCSGHACGSTGCAINSDTITISWSSAPCDPSRVCQPFPPASVFEAPYSAGSATMTWGAPTFLGYKTAPAVMPGTCCPNDVPNGHWLTAILTCNSFPAVWSLDLVNDNGDAFASSPDTTTADTFTCSPLLIVWNFGLYYLQTITISP